MCMLSRDEIRYAYEDAKACYDSEYKEIKTFFKVWCPRANEVLFILFKDGAHTYYDLRHHDIEAHEVCLYIEDVVGRCEKIPYTDIEDCAVGVRNPSESALAAIPNWFENRIAEYTDKLKEVKNMEENGIYIMLHMNVKATTL